MFHILKFIKTIKRTLANDNQRWSTHARTHVHAHTHTHTRARARARAHIL